MPALPHRPVRIGTQDNAIVHFDRDIPIDLHAVANFGFLGHVMRKKSEREEAVFL